MRVESPLSGKAKAYSSSFATILELSVLQICAKLEPIRSAVVEIEWPIIHSRWP